MLTAIPSKYDSRDYISGLPVFGLPPKIDMRKEAGEIIEDQLWTNSCTGQALSSMVELLLKRQGISLDVSALYLYYWARVESFGPSGMQDTGAYTRDVFKAGYKYGFVLEQDWRFDPNNLNTRPPEEVISKATQYKITRYESCGVKTDASILQVKANLCLGKPLVTGMLISKSLSNLKSFIGYQGIKDNQDLLGGHAVLIVGYDDSIGSFIVENSWNRSFGENGFFALPYDVFKKDAYETWVADFDFVKPVAIYTPVSRNGTKVFLEGANKFIISNPFVKVYGSSQYDSVVLKNSAYECSIDSNVEDVYFPEVTNPRALQKGNTVEIWNNFTKIATIVSPNTYCNLYFADGIKHEFICEVIQGRLQIKIGSRVVSSVTPEEV